MNRRYFPNPYTDYNIEVPFKIEEKYVKGLIKDYISQIQNANIKDSDIY